MISFLATTTQSDKFDIVIPACRPQINAKLRPIFEVILPLRGGFLEGF